MPCKEDGLEVAVWLSDNTGVMSSWIINSVLGMTGCPLYQCWFLGLIVLYQVMEHTATQILVLWEQFVHFCCSTCYTLAKEIILFMVWVLGSLNKHMCLGLPQKQHMALVALNLWDFRNAHCLWEGCGNRLFLRETPKLLNYQQIFIPCGPVAPSHVQYKFALSISWYHFLRKLKLNLEWILWSCHNPSALVLIHSCISIKVSFCLNPFYLLCICHLFSA